MALGGYKNFTAEVATSADVDSYLMQGIMVFASAAARDTALSGSLEEVRFCYLTDNNEVHYYTGAAWVQMMTQWDTITPAWTNLTIGSATQTAQARYINGDLRYRGQITFAGDTTIGGNVALTIPYTETSAATGWQGGVGVANDVGTRIYPLVAGVNPSATSFNFIHAESTNAGLVNATAPHTWANTDVLTWDITIGL